MASPTERLGSPLSLTDWQRRLYRNSYTRGGRRIVLEGWSVKIQYRGRRHTFSLNAKSRRNAAAEARAIYQEFEEVFPRYTYLER